MDPIYAPISKRFHENPDQLADAFARAWFKLTHRDMGPRARYLGPRGAGGGADLAGPGPAGRRIALIDAQDVARAQGEASSPRGCPSRSSSSTAWASASTFRGSDKRGGANGARIRLAPQKDWEVNQPRAARRRAGEARGDPEGVQRVAVRRQAGLAGRPDRPRRLRRRRGGGAEGGRRGGGSLRARAARMPPQEQTDAESFEVLEPIADGFRNYLQGPTTAAARGAAAGPGAAAEADRARDDGARWAACACWTSSGQVAGRRLHEAAGHAHQRLLRQPARHGHGLDEGARTRRACTRAATARRAS